MQEAKELANDPSTDYTAAPLEDDLFVRPWLCAADKYAELAHSSGMALYNSWESANGVRRGPIPL